MCNTRIYILLSWTLRGQQSVALHCQTYVDLLLTIDNGKYSTTVNWLYISGKIFNQKRVEGNYVETYSVTTEGANYKVMYM